MRFGMLRSRTLRGFGARLAVFALWLLLAVSAGHIHPEEIFGPLGHPIAPGHGVAWLGPDRPEQGRQDPTGPDADGGLCAICAAMQLVAAAVPPPWFGLTRLSRPIGAKRPPQSAALPEAASFRLFQPRAPPAAV